jgi:mannose-6-phosphate isomerase-like protein (cupin superfamily)
MLAAAKSPEKSVLARFDELVPYQSQHAEKGVPREVMEYLAANKVFPVVAPAGLIGRNALAPVKGWPGLCITIAQCTPRQGPVAHNHTGTLETFFCLDGRFDIVWGNRLENKVTLEPGDLCSVPPGVYRAFRNLTDAEARLLVLIQGDQNMSDKIEMPRAIGEEVRQKHGDKVIDLLAGINMRFQGEDVADFTPAQMQQRVARQAQLKAQVTADQETVYPIMAPKSGDGGAPVEAWPGMSVAMLLSQPDESTTAAVDNAHCQWLINVGDQQCEVTVGDERTTLRQFDMVRVEPGARRTVRNTSAQPARLLLVTQGQETISPNQA